MLDPIGYCSVMNAARPAVQEGGVPAAVRAAVMRVGWPAKQHKP
jgi:expansin (peptidoglycan-binding protein)